MGERRDTSGAAVADAERDDEGSGSGHSRKHQVLSQRAAAQVASIADAVVIKEGNAFLLARPDGRIPLRGPHGFGLYYHDCRFLGGYELRIGDADPEALAADAPDGKRAVFQLTNGEIQTPDGSRIDRATIGLTATRSLSTDHPALHEQLDARNHGIDPVDLSLDLEFAAAFEDVFVIRGLWSERPGAAHDPRWEDDRLVFAYDGADDVRRTLRIGFDPAPAARSPSGASFRLQLPPAQSRRIELTFDIDEDPPISGLPRMTRHAAPGPATDDWLEGVRVRTDSIILDAVVDRSIDDLRLLRSTIGNQEYLAAGLPWFGSLFGRDALITALQTLALDPDLAADTLRLLASFQGTETDEWRDEEPGKILHELRVGELARMGEIPHTPYFGSIDATPLFLLVLARHARWTGSLELFEGLRDAVEQALSWIDQCAGRHLAPFLAYESATGDGLANQGWKDSGHAIVNADGSLAEPPISLVEVQGYAAAAKVEIAALLERSGEHARAASLRRSATELSEAIERDFWLEDRDTYALALQGDGSGCEVVTSNPGHLLWCGVPSPDRARRVANVLMSPDMFTGWGIRTLSERERRYNPIGYHTGTVWPQDNDLIASGLRRYELDDAAQRVADGLLAAAMGFRQHRLPEAFCGYPRSAFGSVPVRYPVACHPQAWAAGASLHLIQTLLGLEADGFERRLRLVRPRLPEMIDRLWIDGLRVADARVDIAIERDDPGSAATSVEWHVREGDLDVQVVEPAGTDDAPPPGV